MAIPYCLCLFAAKIRLARSFTEFSAGVRIESSSAMMATTTNSSISVNPLFFWFRIPAFAGMTEGVNPVLFFIFAALLKPSQFT
jgi:hypothetical protein